MKYLQLAKKYRYYILGSALLIVLAIGYIWANSVTAKQEEKEILETNEVAQVEPEIEKIKVEIKGQVKKPNVYELDASARVIDLINKAGGLTKEANTNNINLSKKLTDQAVVIVYSNDEINSFKEEKQSQYSVVIEKVECPDKVNTACIDKVLTSEPTKVETKKEKEEKQETTTDDTKDIQEEPVEEVTLVNINTASKEQLMTVNGIGEKKALAIIAYREENGNFNDITDIKNVSGIGDSIYEKIKDSITV